MSDFDIRKTVVTVETQHHDGGPRGATPLRIAMAGVVMANPFCGRHEADLMPFMAALEPLAIDLTQQMMAALGVGPEGIEAFGKGSIVGTDGELEHAAMWHAPGGAGVKKALGAKGFVSAGKLMGTLGARLQIPLGTEGEFSHSLAIGADYKNFIDNVVLGASSLQTPVTYTPAVAQYQASWVSDGDETLLNNSLVLGNSVYGSNTQALDQKKTVGRVSVRCQVVELVRIDDRDAKVTRTVWLSRDVPGWLLKNSTVSSRNAFASRTFNFHFGSVF